MSFNGIPGLREFLQDYPQMAIRPTTNCGVRLKGQFAFVATHPKAGIVQESFQLQIDIPKAFPKDVPTVMEIGGRIPRNGDYHVNQGGSLCLGSPMGLMMKLLKSPTLIGFAESCIVPYLFAISLKLKSGEPLPFGELDHGIKGILDDYLILFGLKTVEQVRYTIRLLGMKRRLANKLPCPCGCGIRLGQCKFNFKLNEFRAMANRSWHKHHCQMLTLMEEMELGASLA